MHDSFGRVRAGQPPQKRLPDGANVEQFRNGRRRVVERTRHGEERRRLPESEPGEHEHDVPKVMFRVFLGVAIVILIVVLVELVAAPDAVTTRVIGKLLP